MTTHAMLVLAHAREHDYAVGGFDVHSPETTQALLLAAERVDAPVFLQVGRAVISHMGLRAAYEMTTRVVEESGAVNIIHLDHGTEEEVLAALRLGFRSVMYAGAHLPLEDNIRRTGRLAAIAHGLGATIEAEVGRIPDPDPLVNLSTLYTDVQEAERFVAETGVDLLAISAGGGREVGAQESKPLAIGLIDKIRAVVPASLVLHGASGVSDDDVRAAIGAGVHKLNADADLRREFRRGIEQIWAVGDRQLERALSCGRELMAAAAVHKMKVYGGAGRSVQLRAAAPARRHW